MTRHAVVADRILGSAGSTADAVVIEDGRIVELTSGSQLGRMETFDHPGSIIVPGLIDSHFHPLGYAALVTGISLMPARGIDDLIDILSDAARRTTAPGVVAQRFDDTALGRMPNRSDLDRACPDRPLLIYRYCGHVAVANSAALAAAGIGPHTVDPTGGALDRHDDGTPTGVLRETAIDLVTGPLGRLVEPPSDEEVVTALSGLEGLGLTRLTAIVAASGPLWCGAGDELATLCRIAPDVPLDMDVLVITDSPHELEAAAERIGRAGGRIRFWGWKAFADGSFGGHTAAMWQPYADRDTTGTRRLDTEHAGAMARTALALDGVAAIHAIGDRAIDDVLDIYAGLIAEGTDPRRLRIEHASVPTADAIDRMGSLGVVASVQPAFLTSEASWVPSRLGPDRHAYPLATMARAGVRMIGGSDCPVERPDPALGIAAAVGRPGWEDDEELDLDTAVDLFSSGPSDLLGLPQPLRRGSPADLVVVADPVGEADVVAIYRRGEKIDSSPIDWPG